MNLQKIKKLQTTIQTDTFNAMQINFPEMEAIFKLKHKYEKSVWQTVQVLQEIHFNKMPQKCLSHNNNFSLYCENDHKPLCASCVHQNQIHKTHKILPLAICTKQIARDCKNLEKDILEIVNNLTGVVKNINDGVSRMEKQFPNILLMIQQNYKKLHHFLIEREKEHFNQLRYHKQKIRYQHEAFSAEINKISLFINEKVSSYSKKVDEEFLLTKRCIYQALKNSYKIINNELVLQQAPEPKLNFEVFEEIEQFIYTKLPRLFSKEQRKKQMMMVQSKSSNRLHSPYKEKKKDVISLLIDNKSKPKNLSIDTSNSLEKKTFSRSKISPLNRSMTPLKVFNLSAQKQNAIKRPLSKSPKSNQKQEKSKSILIVHESPKNNQKQKMRKVNYHSPITNGWKK